MDKCFRSGQYKGMDGWFGLKMWTRSGFGYAHRTPPEWVIKPGAVLTSPLDLDQTRSCTYGVHFASPGWIAREVVLDRLPIYALYITFVPLVNIGSIILPVQHSPGCAEVKARTNILFLVKRIPKKRATECLNMQYVPLGWYE